MNAGADRPPAAAHLRLFFALWPSAQEQEALAGASRAGVAAAGGRRVPNQNLHVTLAFLGNVESARLPQLHQAAIGVAHAHAGDAVSLCFDELQHWMRPQILCAAATGELAGAHRAFGLAAGLRQAAAAAGFSPDLKSFRAHVTVARKVAYALEEQPIARVTWNCRGFALLASTSGAAEGSVYSVVESYPLVKPE